MLRTGYRSGWFIDVRSTKSQVEGSTSSTTFYGNYVHDADSYKTNNCVRPVGKSSNYYHSRTDSDYGLTENSPYGEGSNSSGSWTRETCVTLRHLFVTEGSDGNVFISTLGLSFPSFILATIATDLRPSVLFSEQVQAILH